MKKVIYYLILIISIIALIFSSYKIINWLIDTKSSIDEIDNIKKIAKKTDNKNSSNSTINFDELLKINEETVAWINIPGTSIDYSVVQHQDNDYYLTHSFDKSYNGAGWIFLDYRNTIDSKDKNTIIYGHSMKNKTMFGTLRNVLKESYLNEYKDHYIYITTKNYKYTYQIFSAYHLDPTDDYIRVSFEDDENYEKWLNMIKDRSMVNYSLDVTKDDYVLTLSSCWSTTTRMAVHSKLIKKEAIN